MSFQQLFFTGATADQITATGGSIITSGDYKYHIFQSSGSFQLQSYSSSSYNIYFYLCSGGDGGYDGDSSDPNNALPGGAGGAGGNGAGYYNTQTYTTNDFGTSSKTVTIGAGGAGGGGTGTASSFMSLTASLSAQGGGGGGAGGDGTNPPVAGGTGGAGIIISSSGPFSGLTVPNAIYRYMGYSGGGGGGGGYYTDVGAAGGTMATIGGSTAPSGGDGGNSESNGGNAYSGFRYYGEGGGGGGGVGGRSSGTGVGGYGYEGSSGYKKHLLLPHLPKLPQPSQKPYQLPQKLPLSRLLKKHTLNLKTKRLIFRTRLTKRKVCLR